MSFIVDLLQSIAFQGIVAPFAVNYPIEWDVRHTVYAGVTIFGLLHEAFYAKVVPRKGSREIPEQVVQTT